MKATLVNVDSRFNIALRRLWSCYEAEGWDVEEIELRFPAYPHGKYRALACDSDAVWVSMLFEANRGRVSVTGCGSVDYGGIGSEHPEKRIPAQAEAMPVHYGPGEDTAYGFLTRGCIRACWFCKVPKYEGAMRVCDTIENVVGDKRKAVLLDNNLLAYSGAVPALEWLAEHRIQADVSQGLDWRLVTDENLEALAKVRHLKQPTFAFDDLRYKANVTYAMAKIKEYMGRPWETKWYCYIHPDSYGGLKGLVERVEWCRDHEALPYVMRDAACWTMPEKEKAFLTDYAAWCNQPGLWKNMGFKEFCSARHKDSIRAEASARFYAEVAA